MRPDIKLGRIFGVDIGLHYSWLIIALLIMFSLAGHFRMVNPEWGVTVIWTLAAVTALLFFASIVAHELSHAAVAKAGGMPVRSITLFALGGVANMEKEASNAKSEFWMAVVGPATSAVIGTFFLGLAWTAGWRPDSGTPAAPVWAALVWLGYINIALAVFNMIPGYPLDGGRVFRSIAWRITGDLARATRIAAGVGQFIAALFIVFGFLRFFSGAGFGGLWIAFIGWFLAEAAGSSVAQLQASTVLGKARVGDLMERDCPTVEADLNVRAFVEQHLLRTGRRCFIVRDNGTPLGLLTIHELKQTDRERWPFTTVSEIMRPIEKVRTVSPNTLVSEALELMAREDVNQLPVLSNGELAGVLSRAHVMQFLQTQAELKAA